MAYILSPPILLLGVKGRCNCASVQQNTKMETLVIQPQDKEERSPGARNHQGTCKEKGTKESDTTKSTNIPRVRVLLWHSMLRSQHCHCSGLGHCFGIGLIPGKGTSTCYRLGQKKKKITPRVTQELCIYYQVPKFATWWYTCRTDRNKGSENYTLAFQCTPSRQKLVI